MVTAACAPFTLARMSQLIPISGRSRQRRGPYRRWSAAEKAWHLDAFRRSGLSGEAFCREMMVPRATFALWKREARLARRDAAPPAPRSGVAFARVEVAPTEASARVPAGEPRAGLRIVVRASGGHEAALDGVDGRTAVRLVALVLGPRR